MFEAKVQYLISGGAKGKLKPCAYLPVDIGRNVDSEQALKPIIDVESAA